MKNKQLLSALLAGSLLLLASCGGTAPSDTKAPDKSGDTSAPADTAPARTPAIEKADYQGAAFNIIAPNNGLYPNYFFCDEQTGETMDDAIYQRTTLTEEYLNVDIIGVCEGEIYDIPTKVQSAVMSGEEPYQLVLTHTIYGVGSMVTKNLLCDWNEVESVDLSREYWNQRCNENLSLFGKQYYAVSDYMLADPLCILFNKQMLTDFSLENPYELVRSGDWTLDKMFTMAAKVTSDLNGDNTYDINDRYGMGVETDYKLNSFFYSSGLPLVTKDKDDNLTLSINSEKTVTLLEMFDKLLNGSEDAFTWKLGATPEEKVAMDSGRVLFQLEAINALHTYRDCKVEFGIVPYPKMDKTQDAYVTNDWSGLMCIPVNVEDRDMVGKVCEMLAFYSEDTTIPAYYDLMLGEKLSRDEDSKEMLELIFDGITYDPGVNYLGFEANMMKLFYTIKSLVFQEGNANFASWYSTYGPGAEGEIETFLTALQEEE